jgi:hypothetical protein
MWDLWSRLGRWRGTHCFNLGHPSNSRWLRSGPARWRCNWWWRALATAVDHRSRAKITLRITIGATRGIHLTHALDLILMLVIGADSSSTQFSVRIQGRFRWRLEIGEISLAASQAWARTRLQHHEDGGCKLHAGKAKGARLGRLQVNKGFWPKENHF